MNTNLSDTERHDLLQGYNVWEEDDNGNKKIILPNLAELIFNEFCYHFITTTDNQQIYYYNGGYYESKGEQIIKNQVEQFLSKFTKEYYKNEILGYIRDKNYQSREIFNPPLNLINLKNGIYNIENDELIKHNPKYYFLNELPIKYDKNADCPKIKKFFKQVVYKEDIPVIQEFFGYCLYRRYHIHKACMFLGGGANGKSTTLKLLENLLGMNNITNKELQKLIYDRFALNKLYGKLANISPDISDKAVEYTGIFKALTGEDRVNADVKFKDDFDFYNYAKMIFSANRLPKANDDSYAYYRRWILISFPNTFEGKKCNPNIIEGLTTPEELSGLFNYALIGLNRLLENGDFSYGKTVEEVMDQYKTMSDPVYAYCQDYLKTDTGVHILKDDLREHYIKWSKKNKLPITPNNILTQELSKHLPELRTGKQGAKGKQKPAYYNINWKEKEEEKEEKKEEKNEENGQTQLNPDTKITGGKE